MRISIIIPVYNGEKTIKLCLDGVLSSSHIGWNFEVIVVDDHSRDRTADIIKEYPIRIVRMEKTSGTAHARNTGARIAQGDILVFIDADIRIGPDTLARIHHAFEVDPALSALTGLLAKQCPFTNFFSQYKNLYMHYVFSRCQSDVDFLFGSVIALRRSDFIPFDETYAITDDTELGQRYRRKARTLRLDPQLEVEHMKSYSARSFLKNDFFVPFWWARTFLRHGGIRSIWCKRRFAHARGDQLASIWVVYLVWVTIFSRWLFGLAFFIVLYIILNAHFWAYLNRERGLGFCFRAIPVTFLDQFVMGMGILLGLLVFSAKSLKQKFTKIKVHHG